LALACSTQTLASRLHVSAKHKEVMDMNPSSNQPTEFDRFQSLARRILTTPKSEMPKESPKKIVKPAKKRK
jgi:nitrogenase subunit NifH